MMRLLLLLSAAIASIPHASLALAAGQAQANVSTGADAGTDTDADADGLVDLVDVQGRLFDYLFKSDTSASLVTFPNCFHNERARFRNRSEYLAELKRNNLSALQVSLELSFAEVNNVNEREQAITVKLYCWLEWLDCRLKWSMKDFPVDQFALRIEAANKVTFYTPMLSLLRETTPHFSHLSDTEIKLHHSGTVSIYKEYITTLGCTIDIHAYPFDTHICDITFEAAENRRIINITNHDMGFDSDPSATDQITQLHLAALLKNDAWDVMAPQSSLGERVIPDCLRNNEDGDVCSFRQITHRLIIRRHPTYQLLNLVVPTAVTMILSSCVFLTSPDTDKMNLSITVLFVLTMYVQIMYSKMPETGETALLSQYYLFCIALESFSCLAAVCSGMIVHSITQMSQSVCRVIDFLGPLLVPSFYKHKAALRLQLELELEQEQEQEQRHALDNPVINGTCINTHVGNHTAMRPGAVSDAMRYEWHLAAATFDRCYFFLHSLLCVTSLCYFLFIGFTTWRNFGYLLSEQDWQYVKYV